MLIKMNIKYGSKEAIELCNDIGHTMAQQAIEASCNLAKEYGSYPKYKKEEVKKSKFFKEHTYNIDSGLRNSQLLTIAPTGTLSTMLGISGGIEPIFANSYTRKTESLHGHDKYYKVYTPIVKKYMDENNIEDENDLPDFFVTAQTLDYKDRIDMQAIWQTHIDASISSTVNVPNNFTVEQIEDLYMRAWEKGLKGVTVFRDGCKRAGILTTDKTQEEEKEQEDTLDVDGKVILDYIEPITRRDVDNPLEGRTYIKRTACGKMYITINHDENGNMFEVFVDPSKSGGCSANADCLGRQASALLRAGVKVESVIDTTQGVKCAACTNAKGKGVKIDGISCGDVIAKTIKEEYALLKKEYKKNTDKTLVKPITKNKVCKQEEHKKSYMKCPECGSELANEGGCTTCHGCGYSKCDL